MFSWHGWPLNTASLCDWRRHKRGKGPKRESGLGRVGKDSLSIYAYCPPPLPPPSTLPFLRYQILEYVWDLYETCNWDICTSIFIRFAGFDAVTLANNHLNDFGVKGANFTIEVLKKTGVKYFGVTYGKYDTSQVSITCSDIRHWDKPKMLPISVKLLRRLYLYLEEIFCSVFTTLCGLLVSQIFVWGLRIPLIIFFPDFFVFVPAHWQLVFLDRWWSLAIFKWSSLLSFLAGTPNLGGKRIKDWIPWLLWQSFGERTKLHWTKKAI